MARDLFVLTNSAGFVWCPDTMRDLLREDELSAAIDQVRMDEKEFGSDDPPICIYQLAHRTDLEKELEL